MNDDLLREIRTLLEDILAHDRDANVYLSRIGDKTEVLHNDMQHVSGQLDILNHSIYVQNTYLMWVVICLMLLTALAMFMVGYMITRK